MTERKFTPPTEFPAHYVTRDGREAVMLGVNPNNKSYPLIGYVGVWNGTWAGSGYHTSDDQNPLDLFDKPVEAISWINDYGSGHAFHSHSSREQADLLARETTPRIAVYRRTMIDGKVVKIEIEETF